MLQAPSIVKSVCSTVCCHALMVMSLVCVVPTLNASQAAQQRPNILFIAIDDLNDWIGCLGGHPQTITPNLDRLAASGVLFSNAHCPGAACNPSRSAIMTGRSPHRSGLYENDQKMREVMPDAELLLQHFRSSGFRKAAALLYRCPIVGQILSGERNGRSVSADSVSGETSGQSSQRWSVAIRRNRLGSFGRH